MKKTVLCAWLGLLLCWLLTLLPADFPLEALKAQAVAALVIGGTEIRGTELRSLISLRSTAFTLDYAEGEFVFTVAGFGHGVDMSQYSARIMADQGSGYAEILAHYYPGTALTALRPGDAQERSGS